MLHLRHSCALFLFLVLPLASCSDDNGATPGADAGADARTDSSSRDVAYPDAPDAARERDAGPDGASPDGMGTDDAMPDGAPDDRVAPDLDAADGVAADANPDAGDADAPLDATRPDANENDGANPDAVTPDAGDAGRPDGFVDAEPADAANEAHLDAGAEDAGDGGEPAPDGDSDGAAPQDAAPGDGAESGPDPFACLGQPLPTTAPSDVPILGAVIESAQLTRVSGATVDLFVSGSLTSSGTATSALDGTFQFDLSTGGVPVDAYARAVKTGYLDTYHYPARLISAPVGFTVVLVALQTFDEFASTSNVTPDPSNGSMLLFVADCNGANIEGATFNVDPPGDLRYLRQRASDNALLPDNGANATDSSGIASVFNVPPGKVTVDAAIGGRTLPARVVEVHAGAVTRTSVRP